MEVSLTNRVDQVSWGSLCHLIAAYSSFVYCSFFSLQFHCVSALRPWPHLIQQDARLCDPAQDLV